MGSQKMLLKGLSTSQVKDLGAAHLKMWCPFLYLLTRSWTWLFLEKSLSRFQRLKTRSISNTPSGTRTSAPSQPTTPARDSPTSPSRSPTRTAAITPTPGKSTQSWSTEFEVRTRRSADWRHIGLCVSRSWGRWIQGWSCRWGRTVR